MRVDHGETVAIIGETGVGKSTLLKALAGLMLPKADLLEVNGKIWTANTQEIYRGHIATVTQDCPLFARTVKENLCYGAKTSTTGTFSTELISESAMRKALSLACLDSWIDSLPDGVDTVLTNGDRQVSGGQKQRLHLARLFLRDIIGSKTDIVLLDESTSALDNATQEICRRHLSKFLEGKTGIIVTHRHELLALADRTLELHRKENADASYVSESDEINIPLL